MPQYNICILGPKPYEIGGHDFNNLDRIQLRSKIRKALTDLREQGEVLCYTGLGLGSEQDLALTCKTLNIPYIAVLPFDNQETLWKNLVSNQSPNVVKIYKKLLKGADKIIQIDEGDYTPKKQLAKMAYILNECDTILFVQSDLVSLKRFNLKDQNLIYV